MSEELTIIDIPDTDGVLDACAADAGEYKLKLIGGRGGVVGEGKKGAGNPYYAPLYVIEERPEVKAFSDFLAYPTAEMTPKERRDAEVKWKAFKNAFGVPTGKIDTEQLVGLEGWALVGVKYSEQYGNQNVIKRYIAGR